VPGLDDLVRTKPEFDELGVEVVVVFACTQSQAAQVVETLDLPYPIYADPEWSLFKAFEAGFNIGAPRRAWVVVDSEGIIRYAWRVPKSKFSNIMDLTFAQEHIEADQILEELKSSPHFDFAGRT
jgi:peroxiredoxin